MKTLLIITLVAAADPLTLDDVLKTPEDHIIIMAGVTAVGFAIVGMGWCAYRVVRNFIDPYWEDKQDWSNQD